MASMGVAYEEIAKCKDELSYFHSQRNASPRIFHLPTEILQAIFIHLACDYHVQSHGACCLTVPHWVNVSYVCRRWRGVALNLSNLWTYLFILSPRWTEELLARSKQAPLKVNADLRIDTKSRVSRFLEQVATHTERIQELRIDIHIHGRVDLSAFSSRAPRLTSLTIRGAGCPSESVWRSVLFDGDTPMLRTLHLAHFHIPWCSLQVTGLTSLALYHVPWGFRQNIVEFLVTLRCMHDLTRLCVYDVFSSATEFLSSAAFTTFQKVDLPHLSRLEIAAPISTVIALLHCLGVPLKTLVRLDSIPEHALSFDNYAPLSLLLARRFDTSDAQAPSSPIIRSLHIRFTWETVTLTFNLLEHGYCVATSQMGVLWDCDVPLKITIHFDESMRGRHSSNRDRFISDFCCAIPLPNVRSLCVLRPPSSSAFWSKTLGHLQDLRYLKLVKDSMPDLLPLLSVGDGENRGGHTGPGSDMECAPALEKLELCNISFSRLRPSSCGVMAPYFIDVQSLYEALSRRKESKGQLVMDHCVVAKGHRIEKLNVVGRWEDGHFRVVEEYTEPCRYPQSNSEDWEELGGPDLLEDN